MNEDAVVAQLRDSVPKPEEPKPAVVAPVPYASPASATADVQLDDMMHYKLHEYFGEQYRSTDEQSKQRVEYIFKTVAEQIGTNDYSFVVAKIRDLEQIIGIAHAENRMYRLYEWLRLNNIRRKIDMEMDAVAG